MLVLDVLLYYKCLLVWCSSLLIHCKNTTLFLICKFFLIISALFQISRLRTSCSARNDRAWEHFDRARPFVRFYRSCHLHLLLIIHYRSISARTRFSKIEPANLKRMSTKVQRFSLTTSVLQQMFYNIVFQKAFMESSIGECLRPSSRVALVLS